MAEDQDKMINPLDESSIPTDENDSEIMQSIISTQEEKDLDDQLLELSPEVDESLLKDAGPLKNLQLLVFKTVFAIFLFIGFVSIVFFQTQLTKNFDFLTSALNVPNISNELEALNREVLTVQTEINFYRYIQIYSYFTQLSYFGDAYIMNFEIVNSQTATEKSKEDAKENLANIRNSLREVFLSLSSLYSKKFHVQLIDPEFTGSDQLVSAFEEGLKDEIRVRARNVLQEGDREHKNLMQTLPLVGNNSLKGIILKEDLDAMDDLELYVLVKKINMLVLNDLSIIQEIKSERVKWSDIIKEIAVRTIKVDSSYSEQYYDLKGGIRYSSYEFNKPAKRISIVGEVLLYDTATFTMLANLIDSFNESELFEGAEMRQFNKSGSVDSGYKSSVRLNLTLIDPLTK